MKLAVIGAVSAIKPIDGADRIQQAAVDCGDEGVWSGVVTKDIKEGDKVVVFLQDAILPANERWAFMEKSKWRVRMARFKGVPSECLIVPANPLEKGMIVGLDVTEFLGVTKYEKPVPAAIAGDVKGNFPSFIPKTNEENFQRLRDLDVIMDGWDWVASLKYDGTSCTVWNDAEGMHVCSRNLELKEFSESGAGNVYWKAARKYGLERLPEKFALQFEIIGPGIQGNPLGLDDIQIAAFTLHDIERRERCHFGLLVGICQELGIPMAGVVGAGSGALTAEQIRSLASNVVYSPSGKPAEGVVIRSINSNWSFKAISLEYKD